MIIFDLLSNLLDSLGVAAAGTGADVGVGAGVSSRHGLASRFTLNLNNKLSSLDRRVCKA